MTYSCHYCGFIFTRAGPVERCPACDSTRVCADDRPEQLVFGDNVIKLEALSGRSEGNLIRKEQA